MRIRHVMNEFNFKIIFFQIHPKDRYFELQYAPNKEKSEINKSICPKH